MSNHRRTQLICESPKTPNGPVGPFEEEKSVCEEEGFVHSIAFLAYEKPNDSAHP